MNVIKRSQTLDILRAVAIILVLGRHLRICPQELNLFLFQFTSIWERGGWVGVDLFFVLSGFLISGLLFKEHQKYGTIDLKKFYVRRWFKLYPPFISLIAVTVLIYIIQQRRIPLGALLSELLFIQNYRVGLWAHTWSLAVEEHFYLVLPLLLGLSLRSRNITRQSFSWIPLAFLGIAVACLALRLYTMSLYPFDVRRLLFPTHLRIDSLFAGVALGYVYHYHCDWFLSWSQKMRPFAFLGILPFVLPFIFSLKNSSFLFTYELTLLWLGAAFVLFCVVSTEPKRSFFTNALAAIGSRSYSIYVWHLLLETTGVQILASIFGGINWYIYAVFYLLGSVLFGSAMAVVIEYPAIKIRDRLYPSRTTPVEASVG